MSPKDLLEFIPYGNDNACPLDTLKVITNHKSKRALCRDIENARKNRIPILANNKGIYVSYDSSLIYKYIHFLQGRAKTMLYTASQLQKILDNIEGQQKLDLKGGENE